MIIYFADRKMNILGLASTNLKKGLTITDDLKIEDVETGVASFECKISCSGAYRNWRQMPWWEIIFSASRAVTMNFIPS